MNVFKIALKTFVFMSLLTGVVYPLFITFFAQLAMPKLAGGNLLQIDNQIIGSLLISQNITQESYFWSRPSAIDYNPMKPSGGSNLGPTSKKLKEVIEERMRKIGFDAPSELLYASGSGLDPHISLEAAYFQISRIAKARRMQEKDLINLIDSLAEGRQLGFLGSSYVNVLQLNKALDNTEKESNG